MRVRPDLFTSYRNETAILKNNTHRFIALIIATSLITLGYLGTKPVNELRTLVAQICTVLYFAPFILMPIYTKYEKTLEVPDRL